MIFANDNAIIVAGLKHGSTQLHQTASKFLNVTYTTKHDSEFLPYLDNHKLFSLLEQNSKGIDLIKKYGVGTQNGIFNRTNFLNDFADWKNKPLIFIIREPIKSAQSSIVEDLFKFLLTHQSYIAGRSNITRRLHNKLLDPFFSKKDLSEEVDIEDIFIELNNLSLKFIEDKIFNYTSPKDTIYAHTKYRHLDYVSEIVNTLKLKNKNSILNCVLLLDLGIKQPPSLKDQLEEDGILLKKTHPNTNPSDSLIRVLPNFLKILPSINPIYKKRLLVEQNLYPYLNSEFKNQILTLETYSKAKAKYQYTLNNSPTK